MCGGGGWVLFGHSLDFVLGVGFPATTLHLSRVQETVFPYGVGPITGQGLNHLKHTHTAVSWRYITTKQDNLIYQLIIEESPQFVIDYRRKEFKSSVYCPA